MHVMEIGLACSTACQCSLIINAAGLHLPHQKLLTMLRLLQLALITGNLIHAIIIGSLCFINSTLQCILLRFGCMQLGARLLKCERAASQHPLHLGYFYLLLSKLLRSLLLQY